MAPKGPQSSPDGRRQPMISSFFSKAPTTAAPARATKRGSSESPIDLTDDLDDDDAPPAKRPKIEPASTPIHRAPLAQTAAKPAAVPSAPSKAPTNGRPKRQGKIAVQKWRFASGPSQEAPRSALTLDEAMNGPALSVEEQKQAKKLQAFRQKMIARRNPLDRIRDEEDPFLAQAPPDEDNPEESESEDTPEATDLRKRFAARTNESEESAGSAVMCKGKGKGRKKAEVVIGPSGQSYTPLEKQILEFKKQYPDTLLLVEVGYKYKFFGEDAQTAAKELGIVCFLSRNFLTASIPLHRRTVHVKKLVSRGHKVGIIGQTETAALKKVGNNRSGPFERKLTNLYTPATYIDELDSLEDDDMFGRDTIRPLMCLIEELRGGMGADEKVSIAIVTVVPSTGDIVYDEFEDGHMRSELETRMVHLNPCELLPSKKLSKTTERMLSHFAGNAGEADTIRMERISSTMDYTRAFQLAVDFYSKGAEEHAQMSESFKTGRLMAAIVGFPHNVVVALAHAIEHLTSFGLADAFLRTKFFAQFTTRAHMLLAGNTLNNLELFQNQTDYTERGSLMWILDHTKTKFGSRMLRSWVGRPLINIKLLKERTDAVEELLTSQGMLLEKLKSILRGMPDLVKGLCRVQYGKCSPKELASLLSAYDRIAKLYPPFESPSAVGFQSPILNDIVYSLPGLLEPVGRLLRCLDLQKARAGEKTELWLDAAKYPKIGDLKEAMLFVEVDLGEELKQIRKTLRSPALTYKTVSGIPFLVEVVGKEARKSVPATYTRISATKSVTRYHSPVVRQRLQELEQYKEQLDAEAENAYQAFLQEISEEYDTFREVTNKLGLADCLLSLASVASKQGYCRPVFVEDDKLEIVNGRHPMVEELMSDPFVPNTIALGGDIARSRIITGPNMGGKSSAVRMAALVIVMAQIGSYVPAEAVTMGVQDAVLTRMGASDELMRGRSTFMVELSETSDILKAATERSLVILDELGRGTSTFDGMAIASAVLSHLVKEVKTKTLFITHYPLLAAELEKEYPDDLCNNHMGFIEDERPDGTSEISFLYKLAPGMARASYGIECARLAGMSENVLLVAQRRSAEMRDLLNQRTSTRRLRGQIRLWQRCLREGTEEGLKRLLEA